METKIWQNVVDCFSQFDWFTASTKDAENLITNYRKGLLDIDPNITFVESNSPTDLKIKINQNLELTLTAYNKDYCLVKVEKIDPTSDLQDDWLEYILYPVIVGSKRRVQSEDVFKVYSPLQLYDNFYKKLSAQNA